MRNLSTSIIALIILYSYPALAEYCVPPKYYSGPFTGITKVSMGAVVKPSSNNVGYADYTKNTGTIQVIKGTTDSITVDIYYDRSMLAYFEGNINLRVWIDWNQNQIFDSATETMVSMIKNCALNQTTIAKAKFTIPADAKTGTTRMRVFDDMVENDGHDTPNPCGYLNSDNQLGQHGECEDYSVNVTEGTSVLENNDLKIISIHPNPSSNNIIISGYTGTAKIYNILGTEVWNGFIADGMKIDVSNLSEGVYYIRLANEVRSFIIEK